MEYILEKTEIVDGKVNIPHDCIVIDIIDTGRLPLFLRYLKPL